MRRVRITVTLGLLAAAATAAMIVPDAALAQARDCVIVGNINPIGIDSSGFIEMNAGETCKMHLTASGVADSVNVSLRPKNGTLTMEGAGSATYQPKAGFTGTDEFAITITGRGPTSSGTSVLTVKANVK
jgi:hypothetical protein